ncbi:MAG: DUF1080 domain-containing protein [Phycisphaerae bacterium]|nr:DUF1080 domain-containing protein [Phycisphaerae bacterium]
MRIHPAWLMSMLLSAGAWTAAIDASEIVGFTPFGGTWTLSRDELSCQGGPGPRLICDLPAFSSGEVGVEILFPAHASGNAGLVVKASDCGIGADAFNGYEIALETSGRLILGRHRQNFESIQTIPCAVPLNQWLSLVVRMTETQFEVLLNGKSLVQYEDREHPLPRGQVGLRNWQRGSRYRNFWVRTNGAKQAIPFDLPYAEGIRKYDDATVSFDPQWQPTVVSHDPPYGMRSDAPGARVTLDFTGTSVDLVHQAGTLGAWGVIASDTGQSFGLASVAVDGQPVAALANAVTLDAQGRAVIDTSQRGRTPLVRGLPVARHRLTLTNLGRSREPGGSAAVVVVGFVVDTEPCDTLLKRRAWRGADAVRISQGWRKRAAQLAASVREAQDLARIEAMVTASRELEAASARMRSLRAQAPWSPMAERERACWTPNAETQAYLDRLAALKHRVDRQLAAVDALSFESLDDPRYTSLLADVRALDRDMNEAFDAEVRSLAPIIFFTGAPLRSGAVPNYVWQSEPDRGQWGCSIRTWDPARPQEPARVIFEDTDSIIFDLNLSYDAKTVFFSMRRNRAQCWQIYEMGVDGSGLKQITHGLHYNVCPVPLPDGRIAFLSSRTPGYHTVCQSGPSTHVTVMDRDGSHARDLSTNTLSDFGLSMLQDGRLLFTRWEYVDVTLTYRQSLWTQLPDGRQFQLYFGNTILDPATFWQAREIPGRNAVVCTMAPHHNSPYGAIGLIRNQFGVEAPRDVGFRWITNEFPAVLDLDLFWSYRDPYPVGENRFLVSYGGGGVNRFRIFLLDDLDNQQLVYEDPDTSCFYAQTLLPRPVPTTVAEPGTEDTVRTLHVPAAPPGQPDDLDVPLGTFFLADVYQGLQPYVRRGQVKTLRIMEQLPKTVDRTWYTVLDQGPLMGASSYYAKRVWGYAPVEADGSAYFEAPAGKEIYFQACDEAGRELHRMTSATQLMPGETQSCVGCHESRQSTAPTSARTALAMQRPPTRLTLPPWGNAGILDYSQVIQPILDRHCVTCHEGTDPDGGVLLTGDYTRFFNMSYDHLVMRTHADEVSRDLYTGRSRDLPMVQSLHLLYGIMVPFKPGQSGSQVSRLPDYFKEAHCRAQVPPSDLRRIYEWIDAMIPYYATTDYAHLEARSNRDKWGDPDRKDILAWFTEGFAPVYDVRCASCHGKTTADLGLPQPEQWSWINLTRPDWSPALTAHLAKAAGGQGIGAQGFEFAGTNDPDYQTLLKAITEGKRKAYETPEADMPGFVNRSADRAFRYRDSNVSVTKSLK